MIGKYTENYNKIYSIFQKNNLPHRLSHKCTLKIVDSLNEIFIFNKKYNNDIIDEVTKVIEGFFKNSIKFGGYDLDDKSN